MRIYPAIDLKGGRVVRLLQGLADRETVYFEDPQEPAQRWKAAGAEWIHVIDLDGAFSGRPQHEAALEGILSTGLKVQLGGGMRSVEAIERALSQGVARVVVGTRAASDYAFVESIVELYGSQVAIGIDAKEGKVAVKGWVETRDESALDMALAMEGCGVQTIIYTDIGRDGMLTGPNVAAQVAMLSSLSCQVIASGGVSQLSDIEQFCQLSHKHSNLDGVIVGKALYEGKFELADAITLGLGE